jgi:hypothetical protein
VVLPSWIFRVLAMPLEMNPVYRARHKRGRDRLSTPPAGRNGPAPPRCTRDSPMGQSRAGAACTCDRHAQQVYPAASTLTGAGVHAPRHSDSVRRAHRLITAAVAGSFTDCRSCWTDRYRFRDTRAASKYMDYLRSESQQYIASICHHNYYQLPYNTALRGPAAAAILT